MPNQSCWAGPINWLLSALSDVPSWTWAAGAVNVGAMIAAWISGFFRYTRDSLVCCQQLQCWAYVSLAVAGSAIGWQQQLWTTGAVHLDWPAAVWAISAVALAGLAWYDRRYALNKAGQVACFRLQFKRELCWLALHVPLLASQGDVRLRTARIVISVVLLTTGSMMHLLFWAATQPCSPPASVLGMFLHLIPGMSCLQGSKNVTSPAATPATAVCIVPPMSTSGSAAGTAQTSSNASSKADPVSPGPSVNAVPAVLAAVNLASPALPLPTLASSSADVGHSATCLHTSNLSGLLLALAFACYFRFIYCLMYLLFLVEACWSCMPDEAATYSGLGMLLVGLLIWVICTARLTVARLKQAECGQCQACKAENLEAQRLWSQVAWLQVT